MIKFLQPRDSPHKGKPEVAEKTDYDNNFENARIVVKSAQVTLTTMQMQMRVNNVRVIHDPVQHG